MNKNDVEKRLKELKIEDFIWVIYIGIIFFSWIANDLERKYFVNNDLLSKDKYRNIQTIIFSILLIVYIYFLYESIEDIKNIKDTDTEKKKILTEDNSNYEETMFYLKQLYKPDFEQRFQGTVAMANNFLKEMKKREEETNQRKEMINQVG